MESIKKLARSFVDQQSLIVVALSLAISFLLYHQALHYGFFFVDDIFYVTENPYLQDVSFRNLLRLLRSVVLRNYAPVHMLSYLLDRIFFGFAAWGYHLHNLMLHAVNGLLVFLLGRRILKSATGALLVSSFFLVHPIQVESVVWIAERKNLLVTSFMLLSLLTHVSPTPHVRLPVIAPYRAFYWCALLTKPVAVVLPLLWVVAGMREGASLRKSLWSTRWDFLIAFLFAGLTRILQSQEPGGGPHVHFLLPWSERILLMLALLLFYVKQVVWPFLLSLYYEFPLTASALIPGALLSCLIFGTFINLSSKDREGVLLFSLSSFILLLAPVLNLIPITTLANDRYLYLPIVFLGFFIVRAGLIAFKKWHAALGLSPLPLILGGLIGLLVILGGLSFLTVRRVSLWQDERALWEDTYRKAPHLPNVRRIWAEFLAGQGDRERALQEFQALLSDPSLHPKDRMWVERSFRRSLG